MKWLLAMLLAAAPIAAQDRADAPYSWTHFKPGTSTRSRITIVGGAASERMITLKEVTDKEIVFEMVNFAIPAKEGKKSILREPRFRLDGGKVAEETLKFKGVDHKCRVLKANYESSAGVKAEERYWIAEGVAFPLKLVDVSSGAESWMNGEMNSILVSLDEELTIAGRKLKCAKYEATLKGPRTGSLTTWMCSEIPGGLVRSETEIESAGTKTKIIGETIEFEVKK